jgi:hypothetical protein
MMRRWIGMSAMCAALLAPGSLPADDGRDALARLESGEVWRGLVREQDVSLLFAYLRLALAAAIEGREAPPVPEELTGRVESLGQALKAQGALAALALLAMMEQRAKQALREAPTPRPALPPSQPATRI